MTEDEQADKACMEQEENDDPCWTCQLDDFLSFSAQTIPNTLNFKSIKVLFKSNTNTCNGLQQTDPRIRITSGIYTSLASALFPIGVNLGWRVHPPLIGPSKHWAGPIGGTLG